MNDDIGTIRWNNYDIMKAYKHKSSKKDISEKKDVPAGADINSVWNKQI